jgi:nucleoside 2-deoxyribosyltransferase
MEAERTMALSEIDEMVNYLENRAPSERIPLHMLDKIFITFQRGIEAAYPLSSEVNRRFLDQANEAMKAKRGKIDVTFSEILPIAHIFKDLTASILGRKRTGEYATRRLERRIDEVEEELSRLRSNPHLERKVAKLEEEVRKVRLASVATSENEGKEQEDILKKYKAAENKLFVIMPFSPTFDDVWKGGIERACSSEGFVCLRVDKISLSTWISEDIEKCIEMADVVISDITGNNPNVMFELGWSLAKGKKPIVIRQQDDPNQVPFDVHEIRYIQYVNSWSGIENLCKQICKFIKSTSETLGRETKKQKGDKKKSESSNSKEQ